jgi:hypothetical protein
LRLLSCDLPSIFLFFAAHHRAPKRKNKSMKINAQRRTRRYGAAEPALLAHHFTQAGVGGATAEWWGKAGKQSIERSALFEAAEQITRALAQIAFAHGDFQRDLSGRTTFSGRPPRPPRISDASVANSKK